MNPDVLYTEVGRFMIQGGVYDKHFAKIAEFRKNGIVAGYPAEITPLTVNPETKELDGANFKVAWVPDPSKQINYKTIYEAKATLENHVKENNGSLISI